MSPGADIAAEKDATRRRAREERRALSASHRAEAAERLVSTVLGIPDIAAARTVLAYGATAEELDVGPLVAVLRGKGAAVAFPRIEAPGVLGLHLVESDADLVTGQLGIREPAEHAARVAHEQIDLVLVPGVAFDERGYRLGYGGGYYDRLLTTLRDDCVTVGIAFDEQVLEAVPALSHDQRVGWLATPTRAVRTGTYLP